MKETATDAVRLEVRRAYYEVDAARQQVEVARAAIAQSQESLRINQDRYEAGLLTITDLWRGRGGSPQPDRLLGSASTAITPATPDLELASGTLNPQSPVVTP